MAGTLLTFAGLVCSNGHGVRGRGYDADISWVELLVSDFPAAVELTPATPGQVGGNIPLTLPDLGRIKSSNATPVPFPEQKRLVFAGTLCIAEADDDGREYVTVLHPLYVKTVERVRKGRNGRARLRVTLVDERHFGGRGFLGRWSYNRTRADHTLAPDSVKANGEPYSLAEICAQVVAAMPRSPVLSAFPEPWSKRYPPIEWPPFCPPATAAAELERRAGCEPPCLRLDGSVAFHRLGDGRVAYAPNGRGANTQDLPDDLKLWKQGAGEGYSIELAYPDDYVLVRGRERIGTVALDDCEAVLVLRISSANPDRGLGQDVKHTADVEPADDFEIGEPRVLPMTDAVIRALTGDKLNLDSLRRWILQPPIMQDFLGLPDRITRVLRDQAWRLWRIPKVVIYDTPGLQPADIGKVSGELAPLARQGAAGGSDGDQSPVGPASGDVLSPVSRQGPNANLLPLLPCAETVDGRRVPLVVHTYRHKSIHTLLSGKREEALRGGQARGRMNEILERARVIAHLKRVSPPDAEQREVSLPPQMSLEQLGFGPQSSEDFGVPLEDFQRAVDQGRLLQRMAAIEPSLAAEYEHELRAAAASASKIRGTPDVALIDIGKRAAEFERQSREARQVDVLNADRTAEAVGLGAPISDRLAAQQRVYLQSLGADLRALAGSRDHQQEQTASGVPEEDTIPPEFGPIVVQNLPRARDAAARIYSAELGIFEVSKLPGWLDPANPPVPAASRFVPKPVRIAFGSVLRPAAEGAETGQTLTRGASNNRLGDLKDAVTWFVRAFRRGAAPGVADPVALEAVPPGEAVVLPLNEHELIPLSGEGNTSVLEVEAIELARERFRVKPKVEAATWVVGRPWPVQCDGVVQRVEWVMREGGKGFETRITVGGGMSDPNPGRTRTRPPAPKDIHDGRRREGTEPR